MSNDFEIIQGNTKVLEVYVYENNSLMNFSSANDSDIEFGMKYLGQYNDNSVIYKKIGSGIEVINNDSIEITIDSNDTSDINGKLKYEIRIKDTSNNVFSPIEGFCTIKPSSIKVEE